ncbi:bifunctional methylenetetrahydrofolate dehydrogenase/methenyltetrahydrofolate cyclohydrolase [Ketogulonicigenium vulgare]|uniref:bifunctional methylenetetrahydrofolate dehydrogenase/methenyltetrahydrofolate cyclohydrolase n=1 Tax=Ketogulonicigenium vulgare TaxID=92945 RepID=UPI0001E6748A|nr:bifunctional methylenetetrahydrofolate dehydrogenase/methenyltetrahydrofolate cyclohydrolase [Ketogulonicigenium vulgare]ADO43176.1 Methylenetetrahydrofolate dehydrogenase (NADP(+)) [Ketogulonicigenium vulgare Y25]ALJ81605.1 bifunctional 5,10-methylene-tetrahydrofolate dehydrogenase/5,10-methylene-tetrahydrofolate cyclohydrolase [Ketogulonicigenium vulgare]ANW34282.1 bifunctional methylenetetrahydrofolate dehydrogenase/methenyltetrahydrofolate cyclohydrolase [Ketogulonicigenium vulgare]AOZ55
MALLLDGDALAAKLRQQMTERVAASGIRPVMATVLVGDNPASESYVARKHKDCREIGIEALRIRLPAGASPEQVLAEVARLNDDPSVDGFFVQFPLPEGHDEQAIAAAIRPDKDIDGLHPENLGRLITGKGGIPPCTPMAVLSLLRGYNVPLAGKHVVIIGRGLLVGRPLAMVLSAPGVDASVTLLHSQTPDIAAFTRNADVVIAAAGHPELIRADMIRAGATVVGVGITYGDDGAMVSDIAADVSAIAGAVTPAHGSVGSLTRAMLLQNLINLALEKHSHARN